jgi:hypothetical protein
VMINAILNLISSTVFRTIKNLWWIFKVTPTQAQQTNPSN